MATRCAIPEELLSFAFTRCTRFGDCSAAAVAPDAVPGRRCFASAIEDASLEQLRARAVHRPMDGSCAGRLIRAFDGGIEHGIDTRHPVGSEPSLRTAIATYIVPVIGSVRCGWLAAA